MTTERPRYTPVLVADPAPASGELAGPLIDKARRLEACNVADIDPARVAEVEAECDRLSAEVAAARGRTGAQDVADLTARVATLESRAIRAEADVARWRSVAMERESEHAAALIRAIRAETEVVAGRELRREALNVYEQIPVTTAAEHMWRAMEAYDDAALATATPAPPAAEAGTGGGGADQTADRRDCDCGLCAQCNGQAIRQAPGDHCIRVKGCQRCGEDHTMDFYALANPADDFKWWGLCPVTRQPVLLAIRLAALGQPKEADHAAQ